MIVKMKSMVMPEKQQSLHCVYFFGSEDEVNGNARIAAVIALCLIFSGYVIIMDCLALYSRNKLPSAITSYYNPSDAKLLYQLPIVTLCYDLVVLVIMLLCLFCYFILQCKDDIDIPLILLFACLSILSACLCILSNHLMYILIAFSNNPPHATGIFILYTIFAVLYLAFFKNTFVLFWGCKGDGVCINAIIAIFFGVLVSVLLLGLAIIVVLSSVYIPIKDFQYDVPKQIQSTFQFITAVLVGLITYKVLQKPSDKPMKVEIVE